MNTTVFWYNEKYEDPFIVIQLRYMDIALQYFSLNPVYLPRLKRFENEKEDSL